MYVILILLTLISYIVYDRILEFDNYILYITTFSGNVPYLTIIGTFVYTCETVFHRFSYVNLLLEQFAYKDLNIKDYCIVKNQKFQEANKNPDYVPTIMFHEVYSVQKDPHIMRSFADESFNKEMKKFMKELDKSEKPNFLKKFWQEITKM